MVFKTYLRLQVWRHFGYLPAKFQEVYVKFDGVKHACFNPHDQLNQKGAKNAGYIRDSSFQVLPRSKLCLKNDHSHDISLVSYFLIDWFDLIWFIWLIEHWKKIGALASEQYLPFWLVWLMAPRKQPLIITMAYLESRNPPKQPHLTLFYMLHPQHLT